MLVVGVVLVICVAVVVAVLAGLFPPSPQNIRIFFERVSVVCACAGMFFMFCFAISFALVVWVVFPEMPFACCICIFSKCVVRPVGFNAFGGYVCFVLLAAVGAMIV